MVQTLLPGEPPDLGVRHVVVDVRGALGLRVLRPDPVRAAEVGDAAVGGDAGAGEHDDGAGRAHPRLRRGQRGGGSTGGAWRRSVAANAAICRVRFLRTEAIAAASASQRGHGRCELEQHPRSVVGKHPVDERQSPHPRSVAREAQDGVGQPALWGAVGVGIGVQRRRSVPEQERAGR